MKIIRVKCGKNVTWRKYQEKICIQEGENKGEESGLEYLRLKAM